MILIGLVVPTARGSQVLAGRARADAKAWTVMKLRVRLLNHNIIRLWYRTRGGIQVTRLPIVHRLVLRWTVSLAIKKSRSILVAYATA